MAMKSKPEATRGHRLEWLFARHPVLVLETWARYIKGPNSGKRAVDKAKYYCETGRLKRLTRGLYAVVPPGVKPDKFIADPYLVAAALRSDSILSHHAALDLLGVARSLFNRITYYTASPRRPLTLDGMAWHALNHPMALKRARKIDLGVVSIDRQGVIIKHTGAERTLVEGFAALEWVGGLEEHVESAAAMRDLDLDILEKYLGLMNRRILYSAVGWFLEKHPEVADVDETLLRRMEKQAPRQPLYLGSRKAGARLEKRWNLLVPPHLSIKSGFEGAPQ